jgi:C-8 sterol isomerase
VTRTLDRRREEPPRSPPEHTRGLRLRSQQLQAIVRELVGPPIEDLLPVLVDRLKQRWPRHIDSNLQWVFNNAGGAMGAMAFLHGSLTEYLILFGTPIGTEGHSGRYLVDDYFMILDGEMWGYRPGDLQRRVYRGTVGGYRIPDKCWALEYARGAIATMMPFGYADTLSSTLDLRTAGRALRLYGVQAVKQLMRGKV